jgi:FHA domain/Domain of unknown function (DUF1707)
MRPSEDTREKTVQRLRRGYLTGRIKTDTFQRRVGEALHARSHGDLRQLTHDLPVVTPRRRLWRGLARGGLLAAAPQLAAGRIVLGRSRLCHLVLVDDTVSRRHAELVLVDGRWHVRDLGSTNGTWVNGRRVVEAEVGPGDDVQLGDCRLRL